MLSRFLLAGAAVIGLTGAAAAQSTDGYPSYRPSVDGAIDFPAPDRATRKAGVFVPASHLAMITPGMTKGQIYTLLDVPHFHEGLFGVRRWNYILNFYTGEGDRYVTCQYQIRFDRKARVERTWLKDRSCADLIERQLAPPLAATAPALASPPATAVPLTPVKTYAFTFDFDSSDMTADGRNVLRQVASDLRNDRYGEVIVTGFTDTMGSVEYNDALAARRASAAAEELRTLVAGIPVYSRSARDLQVASGPDVREERNRRVVVELYSHAVDRAPPILHR